MKNYFYLIVLVSLVSGCASTKIVSKIPSAAGDWDYSISGTPQGDFKGVMTIAEVERVLTAKLISDGSDLPIEKFVYSKETQKMSGELFYSGALVLFDAVLNGDQIDGTMSTSGMSFPFKATRKN
ncbi:MAG: hypothetical protein KIT62_13350 [Cyclobacteriaceae bacterium]|nr:hypothetical protein [Cyclobacteriaceae bacterium]